MSSVWKEILIAQIKERQRIRDNNITRINKEIDSLKTHILNIDFLHLLKDKVGLEMQIMVLEKEKREEEIECWRDIIRLMENSKEKA